MREKLLAARALRVRPGLDDKVLADWNGLMIAALANAGALLGEDAWVYLGARAFRFVVESMTRDDRLGHSWRVGRLLFPGLSSDYAAMIRAAIALYQATGAEAYLEQAVKWTQALERHHADAEGGGYFLTADDAEGLIVRPAQTRDDALPNPNALMAQNLDSALGADGRGPLPRPRRPVARRAVAVRGREPRRPHGAVVGA